MPKITRHKLLLLLGILMAAAGGAGIHELTDVPAGDTLPGPPCDVIRVVDGDTVVIDYRGQATTVRLIGVDTPETVHPSKPLEHYGPEASTFLRNLLTGESVHIRTPATGSPRDRYGRLLAYLYRAPDGLFVNDEIIRQGYGAAYTAYPFSRSHSFLARQRSAQAARRGLWRSLLPAAPDP